jgi:type III pantothenate kinase
VTPDLVVDIGNSRIKWGQCGNDRIEAVKILSADNPQEWQNAVPSHLHRIQWVAASVHPDRLTRFCQWVHNRQESIAVIDSYQKVPIPLAVAEPHQVGLDRLLNAAAAWRRVSQHRPVVIVDVGTAMTIDYVNAQGVFEGGAIAPGPWLMAQSLHDYTAKLPLVDPWTELPALPVGRHTLEAMQSGIQAAVVGAVEHWIHKMAPRLGRHPAIVVTGGGRHFLRDMTITCDSRNWFCVDTLTLEGIRIAAEGLP